MVLAQFVVIKTQTVNNAIPITVHYASIIISSKIILATLVQADSQDVIFATQYHAFLVTLGISYKMLHVIPVPQDLHIRSHVMKALLLLVTLDTSLMVEFVAYATQNILIVTLVIRQIV